MQGKNVLPVYYGSQQEQISLKTLDSFTTTMLMNTESLNKISITYFMLFYFKEYPLQCLFLESSRLIHVGWQMSKYLEMNMLTAVVSYIASHLLSRGSHWVLIYELIKQNYIFTGTLFISHYKFKIQSSPLTMSHSTVKYVLIQPNEPAEEKPISTQM